MKDCLSVCLVDGYLKYGAIVLSGHEDDVPDTEDLNVKGWPWEKYGYAYRSIRDMYFHLFLGYKIERRVFPDAMGDAYFALAAISGRPLDLEDLRVEVDRAKIEYLRKEHRAGLARAGLSAVSGEELAAIVKAKVSNSYIYNLRYYEEHDTSMFNLMLEVQEPGSGVVTRLEVVLEYRPEEGLLKLVTLY